MYARGSRKGQIKFALRPAKTAKEVQVAGDFNEWQPVPLKKQKDGNFTGLLTRVRSGGEYKFIVDGQWVADPDNDHWAPDPYGGVNSVVLEGDGAEHRMSRGTDG